MPDDGPGTVDRPGLPTSVSEDDAPEQGSSEHHGLGEEATPDALPAMEPFRTLLRWLGLAEQAAGVVLLGVILALVLVQVFQRYLPGGGWAWTGEIARYSMVWATFFMAGYLLAHDQHIAIKVVDYFLSVRALGTVKLLGHVLIAVTCLVAVYATFDFMSNDRGQVTAAAQVPLSVIFAVVAFGFASTALRAIVVILVQDLPEIRTGEKGIA
jgi:TRAP-type C4-dicarboxylate transport system permease small subunit